MKNKRTDENIDGSGVGYGRASGHGTGYGPHAFGEGAGDTNDIEMRWPSMTDISGFGGGGAPGSCNGQCRGIS